ncbi:39S ribosomal protein S30, mitochondrial-like [Rhagoletis pomonella]|uniref:39S ribosomal protein S30, mitochondrial-like n=1 Tax=Rhagoletis pomonella TaxID=28610 RepID=UPI00177DA21A|nr:39S ribosomal protein S30, mitochondrial-like [Rhagoletis pomonella]
MLRLGLSNRICGGEQIFSTWSRLASTSPASAAPSALPKSTRPDDEYIDEAVYPEIQDLSFRARKKRESESWHEEIRRVPTVEEKLIKINMPRYYGYKVVKLSDSKVPYNSLPAMQHYTRTIYEDIKISGSSSEGDLSGRQKEYLASMKTDLQDAIEYIYDYYGHEYGDNSNIEPQEREKIFARLIVEQVNRTLINVLSADYVHLQEFEIDYTPRHEASWSVGGIKPPKNVVKSMEGREWQKYMANDPYNRFMQYSGTPFLAIRHHKQLSPWKNETESTNADLAKTIPRFNYDPRTLGYVSGHQHLTNIPGFWPGSTNLFGNISYQSRAFLQIRPDTYGVEDFKEALHAHAIQSSYSWLLAQACYNGFNTFNELTYPMNTQTVLTNGRDWSFYEYQLNTLLVHSNHVDDNPRVNFCRGTPELQLYSEISDTGKVVDLNEDVLRHLIRFYVNVPVVQRSENELHPYLGPDVKYVADYKNDEQRQFLERVFKNLMSNRPRHLPLPEIYLWEKIYKIDNKTRQMEAKRRFFELDINPWARKLDQHQKEYIPRALRPEGPKSKKKWKPTFYP